MRKDLVYFKLSQVIIIQDNGSKTVQESLRVTKLFYTLLELNGGEIVFNYYPKNEQALRQKF